MATLADLSRGYAASPAAPSGRTAMAPATDLVALAATHADDTPEQFRQWVLSQNPGMDPSTLTDKGVTDLLFQLKANRGDFVTPYGTSGVGFTSTAARDPTAQELENKAISDQLAGRSWWTTAGRPAAISGALMYGGAAGLGALGEAGAAGGEAGAGLGTSASTAATGVAPAATQGVVAGGLGGSNTGLLAGAGVAGAAPALAGAGGAGTGAASEEAMMQAMRQQELNSLAASGAGSGLGSGGTGTALSRILNGTYTTADLLSVGGNAGSTLLGVLGSRNQAKAYGDLTNQYMGMGAPSRARYEASMTPGFDPMSIPGYSGAIDTASKGLLARLAATGGNPYGNPGGLIEANKQIIAGTALPAIQQYQNQNASTGGYNAFNTAAPAAANAGIGATGNIYNAVGSGLAGLLNPQPSILETLRGLGVQGLS